MWGMGPKVGMGGEHHRYYKHTKFRQNPRGDPKFLVDLTWNDPYDILIVFISISLNLKHGLFSDATLMPVLFIKGQSIYVLWLPQIILRILSCKTNIDTVIHQINNKTCFS